METIILFILVIIAAYIFGDMFGFERGYRAGEQEGKLDQHLYNEKVERKRKFRPFKDRPHDPHI